MKVVVSACLLGRNCKYNGGNNLNQKVLDFLEGKEVIEVCPEVLGGLPTPRKPAELVDGIATTVDGVPVHREFQKGVALALEQIAKEEIECVILQSRSPSCGVNQIYDGSFANKLVKGQGLFAKALREKGYHVVDAVDI
jgi:uncharacterized protein YbbK (DUF523 family)